MPLLPTCLGYPCWTYPYTRHLEEWDIALPEWDPSLVEQPLSLLVHHCDIRLSLGSSEALLSVVTKTDYTFGCDRQLIVSLSLLVPLLS